MARLPLVSTRRRRHSLAAAPSTAGPGRQWIFGYGSLADIENLRGFHARHRGALGAYGYSELAGFARTWTVAMDNSRTLPGYKHYLDATTGARPEVFVAFANIETGEGGVSGILFEVDDRMLGVFDSRERNYRRADVTARFSEPIEGTVWTYVGSPEANARFRHGLEKNALVADKVYVDAIEAAYARAGLPYTSTLPQHIPLVELVRVDT